MATMMTAPTSDIYALGHSVEEQRRLNRQGALLRPASERWLREAGLGTGMRVLDIGCGTGDLTRLAAALVGPAGQVIGVDRAPEVMATARQGAGQELANVAFIEADINAFEPKVRFDALIGRLVLMYQPDPAATVRRLAELVRPGGIVAFADYLFLPPIAIPPRPLFVEVYTWIVEAIRQGAPNANLGAELHRVYAEAGLPRPTMRFEIVSGVGLDEAFERMPVDVLRSLLPLAEWYGIVSAAEAGIETLHARLMAEALATNGVTFGPVLATASTRLPADTSI
jgi:ubiquinone/menaquinone biosynthesis C-methylase UbiE